MSKPKETVSTPRGFVVDHKTAKVRYAVSPQNFNPKVHGKVRELRPQESVRSFRPKPISPAPSQTPSPEGSEDTTK